MPVKPCSCGSGRPRYELRDAAGTFCCFYCNDCYKDKVKRYNPSIFVSHSRYALTGEEADIGRSEDSY